MPVINNIFKKLLYQRSGTDEFKCYEIAALRAFRETLDPYQQEKFDSDYAQSDEVVRESNGKRFWYWNWLNSCGGATLKTHPNEKRMFGSEGTGSVKVAKIEIISMKNPNTIIKADVYYADGLGPTFYFNKAPHKSFDSNMKCIKIGEPLYEELQCDLPNVKAHLLV